MPLRTEKHSHSGEMRTSSPQHRGESLGPQEFLWNQISSRAHWKSQLQTLQTLSFTGSGLHVVRQSREDVNITKSLFKHN